MCGDWREEGKKLMKEKDRKGNKNDRGIRVIEERRRSSCTVTAKEQ